MVHPGRETRAGGDGRDGAASRLSSPLRRRRMAAVLAAGTLLASLLTVDADPVGAAPLAEVGGPYIIAEGDTLVLDGSGSVDSTSYAWDLDNDGQFDDAFGPGPTLTWSQLVALGIDDDGTYSLALRTGDGVDSDVEVQPAGLVVTNTEPTIIVGGSEHAPVNGQLSLTVTVADPGDDTVTGWTIDWGDGTSDVVVGAPGQISHTYTAAATYGVVVSVTDEDGTFSSAAPPDKTVTAAVGLTVNSTDDDSDNNPGDGVCNTGATNSQGATECTLRAAIQEANGLSGFDAIHFDIPQTESGYVASPESFLIRPSSLMPAISTPMSIDGSSQPEFAANGRPVIELDGQNVSAGEENGLWITGGGTTIRGLVLNDWGDDAVDIEFVGGNTIVGNFVGTDVTGSVARPNAWGINSKTANNRFGGPSVSDRNVVSGNTNDGFYIYRSANVGNVIQGNHIGVDAAGTTAVPNGRGIIIFDSATATQIGGAGPGEGNVISGNGGPGIFINSGGSTGTVIAGNHIGVDAAGTAVVGNGADAINIRSGADNTSILDNLIAHPGGDGIDISGTSTGTTIQGNTIGTDLTGTADWPGRFAAVNLASGVSNTLIGGTAAGESNTIANAGSDGANPNSISIWGDAASGNSILGNSIYGSRGIGIDLDATVATPNDFGDGDSGPNDLLNHPEITAAVSDGITTTVTFDLDVPPNTDQYRVEFFANPSGSNVAGNWEGERFVSATTSSPGTGLTHVFAGGSAVITATATRIDSGASSGFSSTSEFSAPATVTESTVVVNSTGDGSDATPGDDLCSTGGTNSEGDSECTLRAAIQEANASSMVNRITFSMPTTEAGHDGGVWTIAPAAGLDPLTRPIVIDATTQAGHTTNTTEFPDPMDSQLAVRLFGGSTAPDTIGLDLVAGADGSEIRGLSIGGFIGTDGAAIRIAGANDVLIVGTHLGVAPDGLTVDANQTGIRAASPGSIGTRIGGPEARDRNLISGNLYAGVALGGPGVTDTLIQGNEIGPLHSGVAPTSAYGIVSYNGASGTLIGGAGNSDGNRITASWVGVLFDANTIDSFGAVIGNRIWNTTLEGVDNLFGGFNGNDAGDADVGPNDLLNNPDLLSVTESAGTLTVTFDLDVPANADQYRVEFFSNPTDIGEYGAGEIRRAALVTGPGSNLTHSFAGSVGDVITATVTRIDAGSTHGFTATSEFSRRSVVESDSDGDGLWDSQEDANGDADSDPATNAGPDTDGDTNPNYLDPDDDGDGTPTVSESADLNADGDPRDALDSDRDGQPDYLDAPTIRTSLDIDTQTKISSTQGGLVGPLDNSDQFGTSVASVGDIDGDGVVDLAVGALLDDDGGPARGAVHILFMNADGTVRAEQKISSTAGGLVGPLDDVDYFGSDVAGLGDIDGDGIPDLAVGAYQDDDGGSSSGAVYVVLLNADGTVRAEQKISETAGGLVGPLEAGDNFGVGVGTPGDLDGDGINDVVVGAGGDDDGGSNRGALYVLFLNADGTVRAEQKISSTQGGLIGPLDNTDYLGWAVSGVGDVDGDSIPDIVAGAYFDGDGGSTRGAVYVLLMNRDGTVRAEQKISDLAGGLDFVLADGDWFGLSVAGVGDLDLDGTPDLAVGAFLADDGGSARGRVHLLLLNTDGTVRSEDILSSASTPAVTGLGDGDHFSSGLAAIGDLDGDGTIGLAVGARDDDDGGSSRGAVYIFDLEPGPASLKVNSTGDAGDLAPGDGICATGGTNAEGSQECTLRAAMEEANAAADLDEIHFRLPASDPNRVAGSPDYWVITPTALLPFSGDIAEIDASTQPGWAGAPIVELDGAAVLASESDGLFVASGMTLRGLSVTGWVDDGVLIGGDGASIEANWFGVRPDGTVAANGGKDAIIYGTTSNVTFGGTTTTDGNVVAAGGGDDGLVIVNSASNILIENNLFGVAADGVTSLNSAVTELLILTDDVSDITVRANQFGGAPNAAIAISTNATDIDVVGNTFGTDPSGTVDLSVGQAIWSDTTGSFRFGGTGPGDGNVVRNAEYDAVVLDPGFAGTATILGNSIAGSGQLAFDAADDGPTPNDPGDSSPGPNGTLNHPEILRVVDTDAVATIDFELDVAAGDYRIEVFANPSGADPTGFGEGENFVGAVTVTHAGSGSEIFQVDIPDPANAPISLTATRSLGAGSFGPTSEFSAVAIASPAVVVEDLSDRRTDLSPAGGLDPAVAIDAIAARGMAFGGGTERLVAPPTDLTSGALTLSSWVRLDAAGNEPRLISKGAGAATVHEMFIDDATGEAVIRLDLGAGLVEARGGSVPVGAWHHVVATWDGATLTLYVDGVAVDSTAGNGTLVVDLDEPLIVGNNPTGTAGLDGTLDHVELRHVALSTAEIAARHRNGADPAGFVTIGGEQSAVPVPWTTSTSQARSGASALAAPETSSGADAWITAVGVDEPGIEMTAWWWVSDPTSSVVAAGTRTGADPTDQFDAVASATGLDLGVIDGATRTSDDSDPTVLQTGSWQQIVMSTDELGTTSFRLDGSTVLGPAGLVGTATGSVGFRAADIGVGELWFIDDVRLRRLVSDEPTTSLGPIEPR